MLSREAERIWRETSAWRTEEGHLHLLLGNWGGVTLTVIAIALSGWIAIDALEQVFHLAVTPLAVLWGFQHVSYQTRDRIPSSSQPSGDRTRPRSCERFSQLAGIYAVLAILAFTALPDGTIRNMVTPLVVLGIALAIGSAKTQIAGQSPLMVTDVSDTPKDEDAATGREEDPLSSRRSWARIIDMALILFPFLALMQFAGDWHVAGVAKPLMWLSHQPWARVLLLPSFVLYEWVTVAMWGRGVGGRAMQLKVVQDLERPNPPRPLRALVRSFGTVTYIGIWAVALQLGPVKGIGLIVGGTIVTWWFQPIRGRALRDIISGTTVVSAS